MRHRRAYRRTTTAVGAVPTAVGAVPIAVPIACPRRFSRPSGSNMLAAFVAKKRKNSHEKKGRRVRCRKHDAIPVIAFFEPHT